MWSDWWSPSTECGQLTRRNVFRPRGALSRQNFRLCVKWFQRQLTVKKKVSVLESCCSIGSGHYGPKNLALPQTGHLAKIRGSCYTEWAYMGYPIKYNSLSQRGVVDPQNLPSPRCNSVPNFVDLAMAVHEWKKIWPLWSSHPMSMFWELIDNFPFPKWFRLWKFSPNPSTTFWGVCMLTNKHIRLLLR